MEKKNIKYEDRKSNLSLENRKKLILSGVKEVISFNDTEIILNTNLGNLDIKGENLKMNKLDVQNGDVIIVGVITACIYEDNEIKKNKQSIISKLFK
ncbi:sporulation protein YabP [Clostridium niameyense]|uniref:Sporulation protein YabP n=1 Tax=Clostridium niameyense TaxID=1622073 RepID=A0A6M0RBR5_9CLOT|nr:sporulation protein YabP [Clostridium niameyense]NEZ47686.1 sporulation protein YabP [Clostridium niameyense]